MAPILHFRYVGWKGEDYNPHTDFPAGLVGEIAQYVYDASPRPVREIALVAALGMVAGLTGRSHNVSGTGLNLYLLLLADSGSGKDVMTTAIDRLVAAASRIEPSIDDYFLLRSVNDPDDVTHHLRKRSPSCFAVLSEFGLKMKREARVRANNRNLALRTFLLETYTRSGAFDRIIIKDGPLDSPALTIVAEGAPEHTMPRLGDAALNDGFFARFTVVETDRARAPLNYEPIHRPPSELVEKVAALARMAKALNDTGNHGLEVQQTDDAKAHMRTYNAQCDSIINREGEPVGRTLWSRSYLKALKLAAIAAVGQNPTHPVIDKSLARWACEYEHMATQHLLVRIGAGLTPGEHLSARRRNKIREVLRKFNRGYYNPDTQGGMFTRAHIHDGVIPLDFLEAILRSSTVIKRQSSDTLADNIKELVDFGEIEWVPAGSHKKQYRIDGTAYRILKVVNEKTGVRLAPLHPDKLYHTKRNKQQAAKAALRSEED